MRPPLVLLGVALHLCSFHAPATSAASVGALSPGRSLAAGDKLVSRNGKFALGFFQLAGTGGKPPSRSTTPGNWHLGIWFNKVPRLTPVWVANRENPLTGPTSSFELTFSDDGNLILPNRASGSTVWSSQLANATAADKDTVLVLLDTGNLVLRRRGRGSATAPSSPDVLWQSFDHPTDTLLPDATIGLDRATGRARRLVSWRSRADPSPGAYSMELGAAGVVRLLWNSSVDYWYSGEWDGVHFPSVPGMTATRLFDFTFVDNSPEVSFAYHQRDAARTSYSFLDASGQRKVLVWHDGARDWQPVYTHPEARCDAHAACGPFAVCDDDAPPPCACLRGFSVAAPEDWELDDRTAGCKRDAPLDCTGAGAGGQLTDRFHAVAAVRLPYGRQRVGGGATSSAAECSQACLGNCSCSAYSFGAGGCLVWHGELLNVKRLRFSDDAAAGDGEVLYLHLAAKEFQTRKGSWGMVIGGVVGSCLAALSILALVMLLMARRRRRNSHSFKSIHGVGDSGLIAFRYRDLQRATNDFSDKIGAGGFGSVFRGSLNKSTAIAVKRLHRSHQAEKQLRAEVTSIGTLQHTNLVRMIGFCCERDKRLLVYEHLPNLSLDVHLFPRRGRSRSRSSAAAAETAARPMSWSARYRVALGVARGLAYLHEGCRHLLIHCDIKPQNVLLDAALAPRLADFGMAKLLARDVSRALTTARGTVGYLAPEWIAGMPVTPKVDVYAYGMLLLEVVSGRMNSRDEGSGGGGGGGEDDDDDDDDVYFPVQVARKLLEGDVMGLVDGRLDGDAVVEEVERVCKVACWCIQDSEADRPTMGKVVQVLEGLVELDMPPMPRLLEAVAGRSRSSCA